MCRSAIKVSKKLHVSPFKNFQGYLFYYTYLRLDLRG